MMENQAQHQAVLNLLYLGDQDVTSDFKNAHINPQCSILIEKSHSIKQNTINPNRMHFTAKIKTEGEVSAERSVNSTQNKQNLKRILQQLKDSPRLPRKKIQKKPQIQFIHIKNLNSQPQSRSKVFQKTPQPLNKPFGRIIEKERERELIKSLVKAKIVEKLRNIQQKKTQRQMRQQSFRISTLREIAGIKRGQISINNNKKAVSYHNLHGDGSANKGTILDGKSQINLKQLLF